MIIEQGKMNGNVSILTKGNAKVYYMTGIGTPFIEYIYGPWELFGEVEAFNNRAPVCSIEAINDCSVTAVGYDSFIKWLSLDFSFNLFILRQLADKVYLTREDAPMHIIYPLEYRLLVLMKNYIKKSGKNVIGLLYP